MHHCLVCACYLHSCGSLRWRRCDTLCTSGFSDDIMFAHSGGRRRKSCTTDGNTSLTPWREKSQSEPPGRSTAGPGRSLISTVALWFQRRETRRCWTRSTCLSSASRSAARAAGTPASWRPTWYAPGTRRVGATRARATRAARSCVGLTAAGGCTDWRAGARSARPPASRVSTRASTATSSGSRTKHKVHRLTITLPFPARSGVLWWACLFVRVRMSICPHAYLWNYTSQLSSPQIMANAARGCSLSLFLRITVLPTFAAYNSTTVPPRPTVDVTVLKSVSL